MTVTKNDLKVRLKGGQSIIGTMVTAFDNPEITKVLKASGFDLLIIDCEHGSFDFGCMANMLAMAREVSMPAVVRIPEIRREVVLKYMDMGAAGLLLPNTETPEQAGLLVEYAKYAPLGNRGVSLLRAHAGYEKINNPTEYMQRANEETLLMVQIESRKGVANADAILAVEGIDSALIGPADLSQSLGIMGQLEHPTFIAAVEQVIAAAKRSGKCSGIHLLSAPQTLEPWIAQGMTLNLWASDVVLMMTAAREGLATFTSRLR